MVSPGAKLNPQHVVLIGVRSFEPGEAELLRRLNVSVYFMETVKTRGFNAVFQEALAKVTSGTKAFGISIDLDGIDPTQTPGTGTPVPGGLQTQELINALKSLRQHPKFAALEIAEFDPTRDVEHKTAKVVQDLINSIG
jgi:arginase